MPFRRVLVLSLAVLAWCGSARAAQPPSTPPEVVAAIRQLGDDAYAKREQAMQFLWETGPIAEPALKEAAAHGDPEVRARAERILEKFHYGLLPGSSPEVIELFSSYFAADASGRTEIITRLAEKGSYGALVLSRLANDETEPAVKAHLNTVLAARAAKSPEMAAILLASHQADAAGQILEQTVAASGDDTATRAWAAYLVATGKLRAKIAEMVVAASDSPDPKIARQLALLNRAAGELKIAQSWAAKSGDLRLVQSLQLERRDWPALAKSLAAANDGQEDVRRVGLLAAVQQLAGDRDGFTASLARMRNLRKRPDTQDQAAMAMLLNEQVDEGLSIYLDRKSYLTAFELYRYIGRFNEALALVDRAAAENHPDVYKLRAAAAMLLWKLGEPERSQALIDAVLTECHARHDFGLAVYLCEVEKERGHWELSRARAIDAITYYKDSDSAGWLLGKCFPGKPNEAGAWWSYLRTHEKGLTPAQLFDRILAILDNKLSGDEAEALAKEADAARARTNDDVSETWFPLLIETLRAAGRPEAAGVYADQLTALLMKHELWTKIGDQLVAEKQWLRAADAYRHFAEMAIPAWQRGFALVQAGREKEGRAAMELARTLPLADDHQRHELAAILADHGFTDEAREQREMILRTGEPRGYYFYDSAKQLGNEAAYRGDYLKASGYWEWFMLQVLDDGGQFAMETAYLELPALVRHSRARGMIDHGNAAAAIAELRAYLKLNAVVAQLAIDFIPAFEKSGHKAEADQLFALVLDGLKKVCADYPRSSYYHNDLAWGCAVCNRELDLALTHARIAVELNPTDTNYLDTLAEVHFRAGRRAEAEELMKKCIALEPNQDRHRKRLEAFRAGKGYSQ